MIKELSEGCYYWSPTRGLKTMYRNYQSLKWRIFGQLLQSSGMHQIHMHRPEIKKKYTGLINFK
jgi:hypothetical protein